MRVFYHLAKRFVAGESREELLRRMPALTASGVSTTVAFVGEHIRERAAADAAVAEYLALLPALHAHGFDADISVKLTQLGLEIDPHLAREHLLRVAAAAQRAGGCVEVDMEESAHVGQTLALVMEVHRRIPVLRAVVQAMLRRTPADVAALCAARIPVRLVKGAYKESAQVAYHAMSDIRAAFGRLMEILFQQGVDPAFGTHDPSLIAQATALARRYGKTVRDFEFQMLFGMRPALQQQLRCDGWRVRIYTPYGRSWRPYFLRRLRERKENVWFVVKNLWRS